MKLVQFSSTKILLALASVAPMLLLAPASKADTLELANVSQREQTIQANAPFIDANARYNTLERMQTLPEGTYQRGDVFQQDTGSTGKEASDPKSKESKDGKESCESGACGSIMMPGTLERVNPNPAVTPTQIPTQLPTQLLKSQTPIF